MVLGCSENGSCYQLIHFLAETGQTYFVPPYSPPKSGARSAAEEPVHDPAQRPPNAIRDADDAVTLPAVPYEGTAEGLSGDSALDAIENPDRQAEAGVVAGDYVHLAPVSSDFQSDSVTRSATNYGSVSQSRRGSSLVQATAPLSRDSMPSDVDQSGVDSSSFSDRVSGSGLSRGTSDAPSHYMTYRFKHVQTEHGKPPPLSFYSIQQRFTNKNSIGHHLVTGREGKLERCEDEVCHIAVRLPPA